MRFFVSSISLNERDPGSIGPVKDGPIKLVRFIGHFLLGVVITTHLYIPTRFPTLPSSVGPTSHNPF